MRTRTPSRKFAPELKSYFNSSTELYEACFDAFSFMERDQVGGR